MTLHDLLKLKVKIYFDGETFIGSFSEIYSDKFKEIRQNYPIETFKDYPFSTLRMLNIYYCKLESITDLRIYLETAASTTLKTKNRTQRVVWLRYLFYAKAATMNYTLSEIGFQSSKNHSTIHVGLKKFLILYRDKEVFKFWQMIFSEDELAELYINIEKRIKKNKRVKK